MESLFARHTPKRSGVLLMLVGSLVVHGGLVGIGALFVQSVPPYVDVDFDIQDQAVGPEPVSVTEPTTQVATDLGPTATPDIVEPSISTPPPATPDMEFAEPSSPTPRRQTFTKPTTAVRTNTTRSASPTTVAPGNGPAGIPGGNPSTSAAWSMPHPPYPAALRALSARGATTVQITTDAAGRVSNVVIIQSAGNPTLDAHTVRYVRENWHGPANASRTTQFVYQLR